MKRVLWRGDTADQAGLFASGRGRVQPGVRGAIPLLERADPLLLLQGQADVIEPLEQAVLAKRVDLERNDLAIGTRDFLLLEINGDTRVMAVSRIFHQFRDLFLIELDE